MWKRSLKYLFFSRRHPQQVNLSPTRAQSGYIFNIWLPRTCISNNHLPPSLSLHPLENFPSLASTVIITLIRQSFLNFTTLDIIWSQKQKSQRKESGVLKIQFQYKLEKLRETSGKYSWTSNHLPNVTQVAICLRDYWAG
jgi:hypothetical protein